MTKSEFGYFCAGVAAGALGHKFYPEMKEKLAPYMAGAMLFAQQAFGTALKDAMQTAEAMQQGQELFGADFFRTTPDSPAGANADSAAA
jgi:hypothetical protein